MIPTHATKAGIRYRYYVSLPHLKGESKTVSVGSVSRIPATDIEDIIVKSVNEHLVARHGQPASSSAHADDRGVIAEQVVRIDVHKNRLIVRFKSPGADEEESTDGQLLSIPWQKPPSRKSRQILIPLGAIAAERGKPHKHSIDRRTQAEFPKRGIVKSANQLAVFGRRGTMPIGVKVYTASPRWL
jgi:site-specific DNA recombinase